MDFSTISNLGVAGFSILVMWWMFDSAQKELKANDVRLDFRDTEYHQLEKEVRGSITAQLASSTSALYENSKVMERVLDKLSR